MPLFYRPTLHAVLLAAISVTAAPGAFARDVETAPAEDQDTSAEERTITVTATRTPVLVEEAPATVTIITDEEIADILATDIRDLIRFEPGVTVRRAPARFGAALGSTGRARNEAFIIRGIGGNRVLIQVDGIRSPQGFAFGAQDAGRGGFTDVSLVKQVEILRGPASALYGSDGLAGAVSFTTADPVDILGADSVGGFANALYASADNEFAETVTLAAQSSDFSAMVAYTRRDFQELENQGKIEGEALGIVGIGEDRTFPNPQDGRSNALLGKLVWNIGTHRLRATGEWVDTRIETVSLTGLGPVFFGPPIPGTQAWNVDRLEANDTTERLRASLDWTFTGEDDDLVEYAFASAYWQQAEDIQFAEEDRTAVTARSAPDRTRLNTFDNEVYGVVA